MVEEREMDESALERGRKEATKEKYWVIEKAERERETDNRV